jgi:hypothetical protein
MMNASSRLVICAVGIVVALAGCATPMLLTETRKREWVAERCEKKVQPLMRFAALLSSVPEPGKKVCHCIAQRIDVQKVETLVLKPAGEERDAAVAAFLVENGPMIRDCARETGVLR